MGTVFQPRGGAPQMTLVSSYFISLVCGVAISADIVELQGHISYLEDPSGELTIDQVRSPEFQSQFAPTPKATPNLCWT